MGDAVRTQKSDKYTLFYFFLHLKTEASNNLFLFVCFQHEKFLLSSGVIPLTSPSQFPSLRQVMEQRKVLSFLVSKKEDSNMDLSSRELKTVQDKNKPQQNFREPVAPFGSWQVPITTWWKHTFLLASLAEPVLTPDWWFLLHFHPEFPHHPIPSVFSSP